MSGSTRSLRRTKTMRGRTTTATARTLALHGRGPSGVANTITPPSVEAFRRTVLAGLCPWCGAGPFTILAMHTSKKHDVDRRALRDLAGLLYSDVITPADYHEQRVEQSRALYEAGVTLRPEQRQHAIRAPRQLSDAAKQMNREKLAAARQADPDQPRRNGANEALRRLEESAERDAAVVQQIRNGVRYKLIAEAYGIATTTVREIARRNGITDDGREAYWRSRKGADSACLQAQRERVAAEAEVRRALLVARFIAGESVQTLAASEVVTAKTMRQYLRDGGADVPDGRSTKGVTMTTFVCPQCQQECTKPKFQVEKSHRASVRKSGPYCSVSCARRHMSRSDAGEASKTTKTTKKAGD